MSGSKGEKASVSQENTEQQTALFEQFLQELREKGVHDLDGFVPSGKIDYDNLTPKERAELRGTHVTPYYVYRNAVAHKLRLGCASCWLIGRHCMCHAIRPVLIPEHIHLHFIMHHEEYLRSSNTVKLVDRATKKQNALYAAAAASSTSSSSSKGSPPLDKWSVPGGTVDLFIQGVAAHHEKLKNIISANLYNTIVLFPSSTAVTLDEYMTARQQLKHQQDQQQSKEAKSDVASSSSATSSRQPYLDSLHIIILDGTWKQASHIANRVIEPLFQQLYAANTSSSSSASSSSSSSSSTPPYPPRYVKINPADILPDGKSLFDPLRNQTQPDRCCTLEATSAILKLLGAHDKLTKDPLMFNLKLLVDALKAQGGREEVYGMIPSIVYQHLLHNKDVFPAGSKRARQATLDQEVTRKFSRVKDDGSVDKTEGEEQAATDAATDATSAMTSTSTTSNS